MKFFNYFLMFLCTANFAAAQSISDEELQERFNRAFSVFNQQGANVEADLSDIAKPAEKGDSQKPVSALAEKDKNIVKQTNSEEITSQTLPIKTKKLVLPKIPKDRRQNAGNFILLEQREVLVDMQNASLKQIVQEALNQVANGEKWTIRWRLKDENKYLLKERINLTAEVSFDQFVTRMLETIRNITGIHLSTKVFNKNRIIIITDSF